MPQSREVDNIQQVLTEQTYNTLLGLSHDELDTFHSKWLDRTVPGRAVDSETETMAQDFAKRAQEGSLSPDEIAMQQALDKVLSDN